MIKNEQFCFVELNVQLEYKVTLYDRPLVVQGNLVTPFQKNCSNCERVE